MSQEAGPAGTEAGTWKHGLGCGTAATQEHVLKGSQEGGQRPEAARSCTPWGVDLVLELTESDWGLYHEAARLEEVRLEVRDPAGSLVGEKGEM